MSLYKKQDKKRSIETLHHFSCGTCEKWWSVGDADRKKMVWYCTWCGEKNQYGRLKKRISKKR